MYDSEKLARNFITNFLVALETTSHPPSVNILLNIHTVSRLN